MKKKQKVAFLDRDGVINIDYGYVGKINQFEILPNVIDALKIIQDLDFKIIIVTNQSGINRGYYKLKDFKDVTKHFNEIVKNYGICILETMYCPHLPSENCECRKPKPGMILEAIQKYNVDKKKSFLIGDKDTDIEAGRSAGLGKCFKINGVREKIKYEKNNIICNELFKIAKVLQNKNMGQK